MKPTVLFTFFLLIVTITKAQVSSVTKVIASDGNTTGAEQTPLSLGNWGNPTSISQYTFITTDLGSTPLRIHSTRWGGAIKLTRNGPGGDVNLMYVGGIEGHGSSMHLYNATNQIGIMFNTTGDSYFNTTGNVAIGTDDPQGYKLAVNGGAIFTSAKVKLQQNWPDYVFKRDYPLLSLAELEKFIQQNNHLPEIPSAEEVAKEGLDLGGNQAALLKKIEELTLYIIEQNKEMQQMKTKMKELENKVNNNNTTKQ